jgi:hypothetical protein
MIAGVLEILGIGTMSSVSRCVAISGMLLSTLCLLAMGGFRMAVIAFPNDLMSVQPLCFSRYACFHLQFFGECFQMCIVA